MYLLCKSCAGAMASRRIQRERREVNYNEDMLEKSFGALESVEVHVHHRNKDRYEKDLA